MKDFDAENETKKLKERTKIMRKKPYKNRVSRLDKYTFELLELSRAGASIAELQRWLRHECRIKVAYSTVYRWVQKHG